MKKNLPSRRIIDRELKSPDALGSDQKAVDVWYDEETTQGFTERLASLGAGNAPRPVPKCAVDVKRKFNG